MNTQPQRNDDDVIVETPAIVTKDHAIGRAFRNDKEQIVIGKTAWSRMTKLEQTFEKGKLEDPDTKDQGRREMDAKARFVAGDTYARHWMTGNCSGKNHLCVDRVSGTFQTGDVQTSQQRSRATLERVNRHLGTNDRQIIRMVCGEDYTPSEAIVRIAPGYRDRVLVRLRESLDALIEAFETARRT